MPEELLTIIIPLDLAGERLDAALAKLFPDYSRSRLQQWIKDGNVTVNGRQMKPKERVLGDECVEIRADIEAGPSPYQPEAIALDIVFEDDSLIVINKPAGMVVHPAAGNWSGTLQNALLHYLPALDGVPRAGIVHRLDKDTSGLMVVAKTLGAHKSLIEQLQARTVRREYHAIVVGVMTAGGTVDAPIGRHSRDRKRMCVRDDGKPAVTHYRVVERFRAHSHITASLESGRTHQIRVHMSHIHYPLVGDSVYGGRIKLPRQADPELVALLRGFRRQALHAARLGLMHPASDELMEWETPIPSDMQVLLEALREDIRRHENR